MPRNNLQVEVNEVKENDRRKIVITILAPEEDFHSGGPAGAAEEDSAMRRRAQGRRDRGDKELVGERRASGRRGGKRANHRGRQGDETRTQGEGGEPARSDVASRRVKPEPVNGAIATTSASGS